MINLIIINELVATKTATTLPINMIVAIGMAFLMKGNILLQQPTNTRSE